MFVQKYFVDRNMRSKLIDTISAINNEFNSTVLRYGCGVYYEGSPQEVTVVGIDEDKVKYLNKKIWGF